MTTEPAITKDLTNSAETLTPSKSGKTKEKKNLTDNVKWSIFTEAETKAAAIKASKKAGLKLNEWIDRTLRETATAELTRKAEPPAKPEDMVKDIVSQFADQMNAQHQAITEAQNNLIREQGERLTALVETIQNQPAPPEPLTLKEMIFGRKKAES